MTQTEFKYQVLPQKQLFHRFAFSIVKSTAVAEDVVQEVLLKIWQKREEIDNIRAWGMRLTRNLSLDKIKAANAQVLGIAEDWDIESSQPSPLDLTIGDDVKKLLTIALENLNESQRICWQLREIEAYSYQEIVADTQLSMDQVKINIYRARKNLQAQLQLLKA